MPNLAVTYSLIRSVPECSRRRGPASIEPDKLSLSRTLCCHPVCREAAITFSWLNIAAVTSTTSTLSRLSEAQCLWDTIFTLSRRSTLRSSLEGETQADNPSAACEPHPKEALTPRNLAARFAFILRVLAALILAKFHVLVLTSPIPDLSHCVSHDAPYNL